MYSLVKTHILHLKKCDTNNSALLSSANSERKVSDNGFRTKLGI